MKNDGSGHLVFSFLVVVALMLPLAAHISSSTKDDALESEVTLNSQQQQFYATQSDMSVSVSAPVSDEPVKLNAQQQAYYDQQLAKQEAEKDKEAKEKAAEQKEYTEAINTMKDRISSKWWTLIGLPLILILGVMGVIWGVNMKSWRSPSKQALGTAKISDPGESSIQAPANAPATSVRRGSWGTALLLPRGGRSSVLNAYQPAVSIGVEVPSRELPSFSSSDKKVPLMAFMTDNFEYEPEDYDEDDLYDSSFLTDWDVRTPEKPDSSRSKAPGRFNRTRR